jgi:eukaryotic-like serine/threonine-protein kinase
MTEHELFEAALALPPDGRDPFLEAACAGDSALRERVEDLLLQHADFACRADLKSAPQEPTGAYQPLREGPGTLVGPYKLLQKIGEGGFGVVYMAEQERPVRRMVALKIIKPGMDTVQIIARFESERQALALMDHPNIAKVLDAGETDSGRPYFVMELVKGVPITEFCDKNHMTAPERLKLFLDVCHAIQHAHHKGVIHRDIKPSNVMVTLHDGVPVVKVIDFGVAKATVQKLTERTLFTAYGQMIGTPAYMSPEQAEMSGLDIDTRSDIYSLGVLLYELLTGTTPLEGKRLRELGYAEMQRIIREEEAPRPSTRLSSLGDSASILAGNRGTDPKQLARLLAGDLDWIVMKALEKDRNRRYSTPGDFAQDVGRYLGHEAILARPPSALYRLRKFARRNRAAVVTAALVLLTLAGGIIGTTLGMIRAGKAEGAADEARQLAEQERDTAIAARKETFDALIDLTSDGGIVGNLLSQRPAANKASPAEREFFGRVVARFERLAAALPDTAETQAMRGQCLSQVAFAYQYLGDYAQALDAFGRAADLYRGLHDRSPDNPAAAESLISCLHGISIAYERLRRLEDYRRAQEEALTLADQLHNRFPDNEEITRVLALFYQNRSVLPSADRTTSLSDVNRAIELMEKEVARGRERAGHLLAGFLSSRAANFAEIGDVEKTRADAARVQDLYQQTHSARIREKLGECLRHLGQALLRADRPEAASAALRDSAAHLERLVAANPGSADTRNQLIWTYDAFQDALRKAGRTEEADRYQRQAVSLRERDLKPGREDAALCGELAERSAALAWSDNTAGRKDESNAALDRAAKYGRQLVEIISPSKPADTAAARTDFRHYAAQCRSIAQTAEKLKRWPEAIEFSRRQLEYARATSVPGERPDLGLFNLLLTGNWCLTEAYTATDQMDKGLAAWEETARLAAWSDPLAINDGACHFLARLIPKLAAAGKTADAAAVLAPGLAERRTKLAADPSSADTRLSLRRGYRVLGLIHEKSGRYQAGVEAFDQLIAAGPIPPDGADPKVKNERLLVINSLLGRAICLEKLDRKAEAENTRMALQEIQKKRGDVITLAVFLARIGQSDLAMRMTEEKLRGSDNGGEFYNAACVYALASAAPTLMPARKEELTRRAIALLDKAQEAGVFNDPRQWENAKIDPDLDPLRGREDFKNRMGEWETDKTKDRK